MFSKFSPESVSNDLLASARRLSGRVSSPAVLLAAALCAAAVPLSSPALAAPPASSQSPAKVDIQTVEVKMKSIAKKMEKDNWKQPVILDEIQALLADMETRIARIKEKDKAWDTSSYETFFNDAADKWQKASDEVNAAHEAVNLMLARRAEFASVGDRHGRAIDAGFAVVDGEVRGALGDIQEDLANIQKLADLAQECDDNHYLEIQQYYEDEARSRQPEQICNLAAKAKQLAKDFVPLAAKARLADQLASDKQALADLANGQLDDWSLERFSDPASHAKKVACDFADTTASAGAKVAADYFKSLETNAGAFKDVLATAAKVDRFPKGYATTNTKLATDVTAQAKAAGGTSLKFRTTGSTSIATNDYGIPVYQWTSGAAVVRFAKDSGFCRLYSDVRFSGAYKGGGTYAALAYSNGLATSTFQVTSCPK